MIACQRDFTITVNPAPPPPAIPVPSAYWEFEEATGDRVDSVGTSSSNLALISGPDQGNAAGLIANGLVITGAADAYATAATTLHYVPGTGLTIAVWVKFLAVLSVPPNRVQFDFSANFLDFFLKIDSTQVVFDFAPAAGPDAIATLAFAFTTAAWHLVVAQYDPVTQKAKVSVDAGAFTSSAGTASDAGTTIPAQVVLSVSGVPNTRIDESGIWLGHVLDSTAINALYNSGVGQRPPFV